MAQLLVRGLDETAKRRLREKAARQGRSMEDLAREVLGVAAADDLVGSGGATPPRAIRGFSEARPEFRYPGNPLQPLLARVAAGETVPVVHEGRVAALLVPPADVLKRVDGAALRAITDAMPRQDEPAGEFVRRMRDEARY